MIDGSGILGAKSNSNASTVCECMCGRKTSSFGTAYHC
jgi:hypothetical protein